MRQPARSLLTGLAVMFVLLVALREHYDPRLSLYAADLLGGASRPSTIPLDGGLALRLYATTQPHTGKIASLQKGLVLVDRGRELIEEGYGFGTPIIEADGVAYISRHAKTSLLGEGAHATLIKAYQIDIADQPARLLRVKYQGVQPLGTVVFSYTVRPPSKIDVTVDFGGLGAEWDRAYLMNEQGARSFTRYRSTAGVPQDGDDVGIWQETTAPFGCWEAPTEDTRFCVEAAAGQPGFIGRERYSQYNWLGMYSLSWSGIDIQVEAPLETYVYSIRVDRQIGGPLSLSRPFASPSRGCPEPVPSSTEGAGRGTSSRTLIDVNGSREG